MRDTVLCKTCKTRCAQRRIIDMILLPQDRLTSSLSASSSPHTAIHGAGRRRGSRPGRGCTRSSGSNRVEPRVEPGWNPGWKNHRLGTIAWDHRLRTIAGSSTDPAKMTTHLATPPAKGVRCRISVTATLVFVLFLLFHALVVFTKPLPPVTAPCTHEDGSY